MCICAAVLTAAVALAVAPARASAASPVLEFVPSASPFPIGFTADGGAVTAAMAEFDTVVRCGGSSGKGQITGARSTVSSWVFTGCIAQEGSEAGNKCKSEGAGAEEIRTGTIEAELVFIDQARHEVGMLLNPAGGIYMDFSCGGESVKARGSFLSPVGPINQQATSFTAVLSRSGATQVPSAYENLTGEKRQAIPLGERGSHPLATTGVELGFTIQTSASLEVKAVTAAEVEAKQRQEEAVAAARKGQEEEAAAARKLQEEQAAAKHRQQRARARTRARRLTKALARCRKLDSRHKRVRCEIRAKRKYRAHRPA
jgi:hypothetical protein